MDFEEGRKLGRLATVRWGDIFFVGGGAGGGDFKWIEIGGVSEHENFISKTN